MWPRTQDRYQREYKGIAQRAYMQELMSTHETVYKECSTILERSLQGLVDAGEAISANNEEVDALDLEVAALHAAGEATVEEGNETLAQQAQRLTKGRDRLQTLHEEATDAAREVAEAETEQATRQMSQKLEQLSVEMSGKVREAEEKFGQALKEKRMVQSQLDQADIGTATLRAEVGAQEAEARLLARSACHAASEDSATPA